MKRQVESTQREVIIYELYLGDITSLTGHTKQGLFSGEEDFPDAHASLTAAKAVLPEGKDIKEFISGLASKQLVSAKLKKGVKHSTEDDRWQVQTGSGICSLAGYSNMDAGEVDCADMYGSITVDGTMIYLHWEGHGLYASDTESVSTVSSNIATNGGYCTYNGNPDWSMSIYDQSSCEASPPGGTWVSTGSSTVVTTTGTYSVADDKVYLKSNQILEIVLKTPFAQEPVIITNGGSTPIYFSVNDVETKFPSGVGSSSNPIKINIGGISQESPILIIGSKIADKY